MPTYSQSIRALARVRNRPASTSRRAMQRIKLFSVPVSFISEINAPPFQQRGQAHLPDLFGSKSPKATGDVPQEQSTSSSHFLGMNKSGRVAGPRGLKGRGKPTFLTCSAASRLKQLAMFLKHNQPRPVTFLE